MATQSHPTVSYTKSFAIAANKAVYWFSREWMFFFSGILVFYVILLFAAPLFMRLGWNSG